MTDKGLAARIHCHCQARGTSEDNNNNLFLYSLLLKKEKRLFSNILRSFQASKCDDVKCPCPLPRIDVPLPVFWSKVFQHVTSGFRLLADFNGASW